MTRRWPLALLLCLGVLAGVAAAQAVDAGAQGDGAPTQLWEQFPLDPGAGATATQPAQPTQTTETAAPPARPARSTSSGGVSPAVWLVGGALLIPLLLLTGRTLATMRRGPVLAAPRVAHEAGALAPLAPATIGLRRAPLEEFEVRPAPVAPEPDPEPDPEPVPEPEPVLAPEPEPERALVVFDPIGPISVHDRRPAVASTYEIVWYRTGERLVFALQPLDGRGTREARRQSASFRWDEDRDPPPTLRDAQRAHGRLRSKLLRDGWRPVGRAGPWFGHRFRPPGG